MERTAEIQSNHCLRSLLTIIGANTHYEANYYEHQT